MPTIEPDTLQNVPSRTGSSGPSDPCASLSNKLQSLMDVYAGLEIEKIAPIVGESNAFMVEMETSGGLKKFKVFVVELTK